MQIIKKNLKEGEVTIKSETSDDLWHIHQVIEQGDRISGKTERKIKIGDGEDRKQAVVKKTVFIEINVEKVEFSQYSDVLRVSGKVTEGPEDVPTGSYHTIEVEGGTTICIKKESWADYQLDKLKDAAAAIKKKIIIMVFDREEAIFAALKGHGFEILSELKGDVSKKRMDTAEKKNFYAELSKVLEEYNSRLKPDHIIVASPSFWKEYLVKEISDTLKKKVVLAKCSEVSRGAINEVLRSPELFKVLEHERSARELSLIEDLMKAVSKEEACYSIADCQQKIDEGNVKELFVSYEFLVQAKKDGFGRKADKLLKLCEERNGKVHIISTEEAEKKLVGLGGIAGILRWKA